MAHNMCTEAKIQQFTYHVAGHHHTHPVNNSSLAPAVSANVIDYSSPGVGENTIDPGVLPLATGIRKQKDILQPIEVPVGGCVTAHQHGFQEGVPLGGRQ